MIPSRSSTSTSARLERMRQVRRVGFADGVASVLSGSFTGRPARVRLHSAGSLLEDWEALVRDGERLFDGCA